MEDAVEVEIEPDDIQIDTYRASGAGGQHVNKTDSAVRITHRPTGIVVQCQNERSQSSNRDTAMKMLKGKLIELEERRRQEEIAKEKGEAQDVGWGSQIRSYVLHPYTMVKDHRTDVEAGNAQGVLDGDLDEFVRAELLRRAGDGAPPPSAVLAAARRAPRARRAAADAADEQPLLLDLDPDARAAGEDHVVAGRDRHLDAHAAPPVEPGADREHDPVLRRRLVLARRQEQPGAPDAVRIELLDHHLVEEGSQLLLHRP